MGQHATKEVLQRRSDGWRDFYNSDCNFKGNYQEFDLPVIISKFKNNWIGSMSDISKRWKILG